MAAVRDPLPVAVPAFHGNRMDVPRRPRPSRLLGFPKGNARVPFMTLETLLPLLALVAISMVQSPTRHAAIFYCAGALLGFGFLYFGLDFILQRSRSAARRLLAASIVYLPLLFALRA